MNSITLTELTQRIQDAINLNFGKTVWIRAEINELRENSGHCYMELIDKDDDSDSILSKCRATCWSSTYRMLKPYFEKTTGQTLTSGLRVLISVNVEFHSVYGLNLVVRDIDPVFTVGEMAARRMQIIRQLEADGILEMNKQLDIPVPAQRIAIISSPTAAGYEDFRNQLLNNTYGFVFYTRLFPATMQGEATEASVIGALDLIFQEAEHFDAVVIIRGGGATTDLAAFDSYMLAANCAQFPLPIIAGIGHHRDVSILDMIAHTSVKTPTAAAEFLIHKLHETERHAVSIFEEIQNLVQNRIESEFYHLEQTQFRLQHSVKNLITRDEYKLDNIKYRLQSAIKLQLKKQESKLDLLEKTFETYSPAFLLKHGYTITTLNGKRVYSAESINKNDKIRTYFADGHVDSEVVDN